MYTVLEGYSFATLINKALKLFQKFSDTQWRCKMLMKVTMNCEVKFLYQWRQWQSMRPLSYTDEDIYEVRDPSFLLWWEQWESVRQSFLYRWRQWQSMRPYFIYWWRHWWSMRSPFPTLIGAMTRYGHKFSNHVLYLNHLYCLVLEEWHNIFTASQSVSLGQTLESLKALEDN